jgi:FAD synthase
LLRRINLAQSPTKVALTGNSFLVGNAKAFSAPAIIVVGENFCFGRRAGGKAFRPSGTA